MKILYNHSFYALQMGWSAAVGSVRTIDYNFILKPINDSMITTKGWSEAQISSHIQKLGKWFHNIDINGVKTAPDLRPEHDIFKQLIKLQNTLRHIMGEDLITHLGLDYYKDMVESL